MNTRTYNLVEVFYRKNGQKRSVFVTNRSEAGKYKNKLIAQRRKYLGQRQVTLLEV